MKSGRIILLGCFFIIVVIFSGIVGFAGGFIGSRIWQNSNVSGSIQTIEQQPVQVVKEDSQIINVAKQADKSVVSIIISKDLPIYQRYFFFFF